MTDAQEKQNKKEILIYTGTENKKYFYKTNNKEEEAAAYFDVFKDIYSWCLNPKYKDKYKDITELFDSMDFDKIKREVIRSVEGSDYLHIQYENFKQIDPLYKTLLQKRGI